MERRKKRRGYMSKKKGEEGQVRKIGALVEEGATIGRHGRIKKKMKREVDKMKIHKG